MAPVEVPKRGAIDGVDEDVSAALSPINRPTDHPHRIRADKPFAKRIVHDVAQRDHCAAGFIGHLHPDHDTSSKQIEPRQAGRVFHRSFNRLGCIQIDFSHPAGRVSYTPCQSPRTYGGACHTVNVLAHNERIGDVLAEELFLHAISTKEITE